VDGGGGRALVHGSEHAAQRRGSQADGRDAEAGPAQHHSAQGAAAHANSTTALTTSLDPAAQRGSSCTKPAGSTRALIHGATSTAPGRSAANTCSKSVAVALRLAGMLSSRRWMSGLAKVRSCLVWPTNTCRPPAATRAAAACIEAALPVA